MVINDLVSVVIPCYNQAEYLEEAVQSIIDQTYPNIEILIINDGSTDNTLDVALTLQHKHMNKIQIINQSNMGLPRSRNNGIKKAKGMYILPLDSDDKIEKTMIQKCIDILIHDQVDIVYTDIHCFGIQNNVFIQKPEAASNILYVNLPPATSLYKREVWEKNSGYKVNMKEGYEDWEFWVNAFKNDFKFQYYPEALFFYRVKEESMSTSAYELNEYLTSKVILNNASLYTPRKFKKASLIVHKVEKLADYYFYSNESQKNNEKEFISLISHFIKNHKLKEKQILESQHNSLKFGLCSLDILENHQYLDILYKEMDVEILIFYAPLRYEISFLKSFSLALNIDKGEVKTCGTIFPFLFQTRNEKLKSKILSYEYLETYTEYNENKILKRDKTIRDLKEKSDTLQQRMLLRDNTIRDLKEKSDTLQQRMVLRDKTIRDLKEKSDTLQQQMALRDKTIHELRGPYKLGTLFNQYKNISIFLHPYRKYKSYKNLLNGYSKMKNNNSFK